MKQEKINAKKVFLYGLFSIPGALVYGIVGIILSVYSLSMFKSTPPHSECSLLKKGRNLATIGLILSVLFLLWCMFVYIALPFKGISDPKTLEFYSEVIIMRLERFYKRIHLF